MTEYEKQMEREVSKIIAKAAFFSGIKYGAEHKKKVLKLLKNDVELEKFLTVMTETIMDTFDDITFEICVQGELEKIEGWKRNITKEN